MDRKMDLSDIKNGFPGMSRAICIHCYEACMVCLHKNKHNDGVLLDLQGDITAKIELNWEDYFDEQIDKAWQDQEYSTEHGAICISAMLVKMCTEYTIIERSIKSTGFDYWLGKKSDIPFKNSARLEISGIFKESEQNNLDKRLKRKKKQVTQSDSMPLPAYISIVEFSNPKAVFVKK
jgi:hypothetical protein